MYDELKRQVCVANRELQRHGLVLLTWGNLSAFDRKTGVVAIKPSGVAYETMIADDIVILDGNGNVIDGARRPSSDTPTHLELYRAFPEITAVVHTHSTYATAFAQAGQPIRCLGTTHADHFCGTVPVVDKLSAATIEHDYERNTGRAIVQYFQQHQIDPQQVPACLLPFHGPFVWGESIAGAVENAVVLEAVARMNLLTAQCCPEGRKIPPDLLRKHYFRKHGSSAYYGQQECGR